MAAFTLGTDELVVHFPRWEALMVRRDTYAVPLSWITHVQVLPGWTSEIMGFRVGMVVSGFLKVGVWTQPSGIRRLVSMKRGLPVLRVGLERHARDAEFDEILVSTPDAHAVADGLARTDAT